MSNQQSTMAPPTARRAYSAEQLLALRRSASEEKALAVQKKVNECAIKDHVVRGSRSSATRSSSSAYATDSTRGAPADLTATFTGPILSEIDPNNQTLRPPLFVKASPTPSIKKKKAEQILQQHGSPPGVRVTAGGRIVPSEHSPLCSPRYGYSAIQRNGGLIKFAPGYPPPPKTFANFAKTLPNGFVAQDPSGRICQMVDGQFAPIPDVNGIPQLFMPAPNVSNVTWGEVHASNTSPVNSEVKTKAVSGSGTPADTSAPTTATQIAALEKHYDKLEQERRSLDKAEVLKRNELTGKAYAQLIQKRRELVGRQDEIRRSIKMLQDGRSTAGSAVDTHSMRSSPEMHYSQYIVPAHFPQIAQWVEETSMEQQHPSVAMQHMPPEQTLFHPQLFIPGAFPQFMPMQAFGQAFTTSTGGHVTPSTDAAVARAPDILSSAASKAQQDHDNNTVTIAPPSTGTKSALNPMSPIYEPCSSRFPTPQKKIPTAPAKMIAAQERARDRKSEESARPSSDASFATADFFPNNPREHSLHPGQYPASEADDKPDEPSPAVALHHQSSQEALAQPELERHNANWNPTIPDQAFQPKDDGSSEDQNDTFGQLHSQTKQISPVLSPQAPKDDDSSKGYRAGLQKLPLTDGPHSAQFIEGYCRGLMQSTNAAKSVGSADAIPPVKPIVRLPMASARRTSQSANKVALPRLTLPKTGVDAIKQAIVAPANESAILSPDPEAPSVDAVPDRSLGAWAKRKIEQSSDENLRVPHAGHNYSQTVVHAGASSKLAQMFHPDAAAGADMPAPAQPLESEYRTFSASTLPAESSSTLLASRGYPGFRVLSTPGMDWKSSTSMAHVAGMATGYFAQFDGAASKSIARHARTPPNVSPASRGESVVISAVDPPSPAKSASASISISAPSSPKKGMSPAKAKFAAIAGKAGIKVRSDRASKEGDLEPMSPQERRRWRDVWKKRNAGGVD